LQTAFLKFSQGPTETELTISAAILGKTLEKMAARAIKIVHSTDLFKEERFLKRSLFERVGFSRHSTPEGNQCRVSNF
jgi:hypothetical protein